MDAYIGQIMSIVSIFILAIGLIIGEESLREKFSRAKSMAVRTAVYTCLDYGLMLLSIALIMEMKANGHGFFVSFIVMWIFDITMAVVLLWICYFFKKDLTNGQEYRRSIDNIHKKSKIAGFISLIWFLIKAAVWDGPEKLVEFLRKELSTVTRKAVVVISMCCVQAIFWTSIYILGHASIVKMWEIVKINAGI